MPAIGCPRCGGQLQLDDQHVGWQVRCPHCATEFVANAPGGPTPGTPPPGPQPGAYPPPGPYGGYAPPRRTPHEQVEYAARQAYPAGLALQIVGWVMAPLSLLAGLGGAGFMLFAQQNARNIQRDDEVVLIVTMAIFAGVAAVGTAYFAVLGYGGGKMKTLQSWGWGLASSILAICTILFMCFAGLPGICTSILIMPFGIWGLVVILNPEVRAGFMLAASARTGPTGGNP